MKKIKSWEQRRKEQERREKRQALLPIVSIVMIMSMFMLVAVLVFLEAKDYMVAEKEDIKVISAVVENVDFREYQSLTNDKEDAKWVTVSTSHGKYYYDFLYEEKIEKEKDIFSTLVKTGEKVSISLVYKKLRSGEEHQFIVDIRDGETVYFSLEDYNEYQFVNRSKYMNTGYVILASTFVAGMIGIIIVCKKALSGEKYGKRNRKTS